MKTYRLIRILAGLALSAAMLALSAPCRADDGDTITESRFRGFLSADLRPAWIIPTSEWFRGNNPLQNRFGGAMSATVKGGFSFGPRSEARRLYGDTYQGLALSYTDLFGHNLLGCPVSLFVYQGIPIAPLSRRLSLFAEWEFGASFGWKTQQWSMEMPGVNGSPVTARLGLNLVLRYALSRSLDLVTAIDLTHFSNGNTRVPNAGTNLAGLRLGVTYYPGMRPAYDQATPFRHEAPAPAWSWDLLLYGAAHKRFFRDSDDQPIPLPGCFAVAGATFGPMRDLRGGVLRIGGTFDLQWDEGADIERYLIRDLPGPHPYYLRPPVSRQISAGVSARGEIVLPYFAINVGIGRNIWSAAPDQRVFYQTLALKTMITPRAYLNVGYSLRNFAHPRTLMIGLGWRFGNTSPAPTLSHL